MDHCFFLFQRFKAYQDLDSMASIIVTENHGNVRTKSLKTRSYVSETEGIR